MQGRGILFMVMAAILLVGLFYLLRPLSEMQPPAKPGQAQQAPVPAAIELVVNGGKLVSGPASVRVTQGEEVIIRVTADAADEFHLHGYDLKLDLKPDQPAELRLRADRSGRFEYELHHGHTALGALEVQPK